jgi:hypothetical protein
MRVTNQHVQHIKHSPATTAAEQRSTAQQGMRELQQQLTPGGCVGTV